MEAGSTGDLEYEGSLMANVQLVLVVATPDGPSVSNVRHTWRTAPSEVSRLAGLSALNMVRLHLLAQERVLA